jgi:HEAT repeat protein
MAKSRKLEALQAQLQEIRANPTMPEAIDTLRQILTSRYAVAIAQAARLIHEANLKPLAPHLAAAFERLLQNPVATDPNCMGKQAIADALYRLSYGDETPFLQGIRHVQMEPVWGGQVDTAPGLRAVCALGLVRINYPAVMTELADLLADREPEARIGAIRALAYSENPLAVPLLRLRLQVGDEPAVLSEGFMALLKLAPLDSLPFVARYLDTPEAQTCEMAALALGESHLPEALPILQTWWQRIRDADLRQTALLSIAMLRQDAALEFLLDLIVTGSRTDSQAAVEALKIYATDRELSERVQQQIQKRQTAMTDKNRSS